MVPVLREGTTEESLPLLMSTRLPADLRNGDRYFSALFDLVLDPYRINWRLPVMRNFRRSLKP